MKRPEAFKDSGVLVTGAAGFIGSFLCRRLAGLGARVHGLDRPGARDRQVPGRPPAPDGCRCIEVDLTDLPALERALAGEKLARVFHLAALTDVRRDPALEEPCRRVNLQGSLNLASVLMKMPSIERVVHFGTCEEYGDGVAPFREEAAPRPVSPYSASKVEASLSMQELGRRGDLPVVVVRPFLTYGPGQEPSRFIAQAVDAALRDRPLPMTPGEQTREFTHVDDMVEGILAAATVPGIEGEIINLASGVEWQLKEVVQMIYRLSGSKAAPELGALPYRDGEAMRFCGSTEKCRRLLDYAPRIPLERGIEELIAWERARRKEENR